MSRQKVLGLAVSVLLAGCGAAEAVGPTTTTTTSTTTTEAPVPSTDDLFPDGLRDVRYCEVLLLSEADGRFSAEVWNTLGLNECPQEQWGALDAGAITEERGVAATILNGPRYWTLDTIVSLSSGERVLDRFGAIDMFRAATVDLGEELPEQTPYTERPIARETIFRFKAGSEVYELTGPDGQRYVMQAYSQIVDPALAIDDLAGLGDRLALPEGWTFATRVLDEQLDLLSTDGVATVVQDDLQNTYQRVDPASAP